jgi:tetratricopeptide (TPR) repeat protein
MKMLGLAVMLAAIALGSVPDVYADEATPSDLEQQLDRGVGLMKPGKFDQAIKIFDHIISVSPKGTTAYFAYSNRGTAYDQLGQRAKALADLNRAIELSPGDESAYLHRADLFKEEKLNDKAIADYSRALSVLQAKGSAHSSAQFRAGIIRDRAAVYRAMGNNDLALKDDEAAANLAKEKLLSK